MTKKSLALALSLIVMLTLIAPFVTGAPIHALASGESHSETIYTVRAYADRVGGHVNVYAEPNGSSTIIATFIDGTTLAVLEAEVDGFHKVILDDGVGYIKSENITTSLSYNQRVSIVIALVCVIAVILILLITYYRRNANYFKSKK